MPPRKRRYGEGTVVRLPDGRYRGTLQIGWLESGNPRTKSVSGKTEADAHRKLDRLLAEIRINGASDTRTNTTVKTWAEQWLDIKAGHVRPNTYKGYRTAVTKWIIPTIGHRKMSELNPGDMRAVAKAVTDAGLVSTTAHLQIVTLKMMLRDAINEGHSVPQRVLQVKAPAIAVNDRRALVLEHSAAVLNVIANRPDRARWLLSLLYGIRQGEALGLTWPCIDQDTGTIEIRWQLQKMPWLDRKAGVLKIPNGLEYIRLHGAACLTPPKSKAGSRVLPILPIIDEALNDVPRVGTLGLVFPRSTGLPQDTHEDLATWHAIQDLACVRHPTRKNKDGTPAWYHTHELRHTAATSMLRLGVPSKTQIAIMGHTSVKTTGVYQSADMEIKRAAMAVIAGDAARG